MKVPSLKCSTTVNVPSGLLNTVKCRLNVSVAQSFPQVPESSELLAYGPKCCGRVTVGFAKAILGTCAAPRIIRLIVVARITDFASFIFRRKKETFHYIMPLLGFFYNFLTNYGG